MHDIDEGFLEKFLVELLNTPSPTGYTEGAIKFCEKILSVIPGIQLKRTHKGALLASLPGTEQGHERALTAHVDTLGAMVKAIKPSGRLLLTQLGGYAWPEHPGTGELAGEDSQVRGYQFRLIFSKTKALDSRFA